MLAVEHGRHDAVRFLIDHNANVNRRSKDGHFALELAAGEGFKDLCATLLAAGANKRMRDATGQTAAEVAAGLGFGDVEAFINSWTDDAAMPETKANLDKLRSEIKSVRNEVKDLDAALQKVQHLAVLSCASVARLGKNQTISQQSWNR